MYWHAPLLIMIFPGEVTGRSPFTSYWDKLFCVTVYNLYLPEERKITIHVSEGDDL